MTKIFDKPEEFAATGLRAFNHIFQDVVRPVAGGALRAISGRKGKVTLLVGGGSGHYPTFCGYVGEGFADAVVMGDVFASPSTKSVLDIARIAHCGGGIVMGFGNYAGDNLNFGIAAERLRAEGIDTRIVTTTDDVASAPSDAHRKRRGVAGDIVVFKIMGAAADDGIDIDGVEKIGWLANDQTRSFGVAFDGCTLPGESDKLFHVAEGRMALGLGIHGEPGIAEMDFAKPSEIARLMFERVVGEAPVSSSRVAVVLNGFGSTKLEELFVLWAELEPLFSAKGLTIVAPLVGEYATSLDMAGCSLTVTWLDETLERYWRAPVNSPALRRPLIETEWVPMNAQHVERVEPTYAVEPSAVGRAAGACVGKALEALASALAEAEERLGKIDAAAGDGDHGQGMARGSSAAAEAAKKAVAAGAGPETVLAAAADAWAERAGGTSGALWGEGLRAFSSELDDAATPTAHALRQGVRRMYERITQIGKAKPGDKTIVDALAPFVETFESALGDGQPLVKAWQRAAEAAEAAAQATKDLMPGLGRAKTHGKASLGHPDAGAISMALSAEVIGSFLSTKISK